MSKHLIWVRSAPFILYLKAVTVLSFRINVWHQYKVINHFYHPINILLDIWRKIIDLWYINAHKWRCTWKMMCMHHSQLTIQMSHLSCKSHVWKFSCEWLVNQISPLCIRIPLKYLQMQSFHSMKHFHQFKIFFVLIFQYYWSTNVQIRFEELKVGQWKVVWSKNTIFSETTEHNYFNISTCTDLNVCSQ